MPRRRGRPERKTKQTQKAELTQKATAARWPRQQTGEGKPWAKDAPSYKPRGEPRKPQDEGADTREGDAPSSSSSSSSSSSNSSSIY